MALVVSDAHEGLTQAIATERTRQARGRVEAAAALDLPMARGEVLFPDAQIEYVTAAGAGRRCNVEVASEHYGGGDIRAKTAACAYLFSRDLLKDADLQVAVEGSEPLARQTLRELRLDRSAFSQ